MCSRWYNHTSGNLKPFSESYDSRGTDTSCSDRLVYIYVLDGVLVSALIWTVCCGSQHTCVLYLFVLIFCFLVYFTLPFKLMEMPWNYKSLETNQRNRILIFWKEFYFEREARLFSKSHFLPTLEIPWISQEGVWDSNWQALLACIRVSPISCGIRRTCTTIKLQKLNWMWREPAYIWPFIISLFSQICLVIPSKELWQWDLYDCLELLWSRTKTIISWAV